MSKYFLLVNGSKTWITYIHVSLKSKLIINRKPIFSHKNLIFLQRSVCHICNAHSLITTHVKIEISNHNARYCVILLLSDKIFILYQYRWWGNKKNPDVL